VKLTDEELSRWIAAKLEPEPTLKSVCWKHVPDERHVYNRKLGGYERIVLVGDSGNYKPRDMVNVAQMTVMLLAKANLRLEPTWGGVSEEYIPNGWQAMPMYKSTPNYTLTGFGVTPGRAVAEAWALATGYKEP
jgi:hypothetical protein